MNRIVEGREAVLPSQGFIRWNQLKKIIPVGRTTMHIWVQTGRFPQPVRLSPRVSAWKVEDVRGWIARNGDWSERRLHGSNRERQGRDTSVVPGSPGSRYSAREG